MPVICTVFMHKSYLRGLQSSEKEVGRCLHISLLRVYSSPLEIHLCYVRVWQRRWKQGMPPVCSSNRHRLRSASEAPCASSAAAVTPQHGWSRPSSPGAVLELSSLAKAPVGAANWAVLTCLRYGQHAGSVLRFIWKGINILQSISPWVEWD